MDQGRLDEAYDYFRRLEENYPNTPGRAQASENYLYQQAKALHGKGRDRQALGVLRELFRTSPQRPGLGKVMGAMTAVLVEQYAAAGDYRSIRRLLRSLAGCYPKHPLVEHWEGRLRAEAAAVLADSRTADASGDLPKAAELARRAFARWPALEGAKSVAGRHRPEIPPRGRGGLPARACRVPGSCRQRPGPVDRLGGAAARGSSVRTLAEFAGPSPAGDDTPARSASGSWPSRGAASR